MREHTASTIAFHARIMPQRVHMNDHPVVWVHNLDCRNARKGPALSSGGARAGRLLQRLYTRRRAAYTAFAASGPTTM